MDLDAVILVHLLHRKGVIDHKDIKRIRGTRILVRELIKKKVFEKADYDGAKGSFGNVARHLFDAMNTEGEDFDVRAYLEKNLTDLLNQQEIDALVGFMNRR